MTKSKKVVKKCLTLVSIYYRLFFITDFPFPVDFFITDKVFHVFYNKIREINPHEIRNLKKKKTRN